MATIETAARPRSAARGDVVPAAALAMIAVQLVWKFDLVRRTYFRQDDFFFIARGLERELSWDYLMRVDYGHLVPGPFAMQWAMGRLGVYNDVLAHVVVIGLQAAAGLALLRLLHTLFGARPAILVPLGLYLLTPMTISALSWWAVAIETLPFQIALPMALCAHVGYLRTGRLRHALAAAAWTAFAMLFFVKAPFVLVLAFVLTLGWFPRANRKPAWLLYLFVIALYAVVFFRQFFTSVQLTNDTVRPELPDPAVAAGFAWKLLSESLVTSALGGPWRWRPIGGDYAITATPPALIWVSLAVAALVVTFSVVYRRRAWLAWTMLLGYFAVADVVPVTIGRITQLGPDLGGAELRYISSTSAVLAIVVALAFIPLRDEPEPWRRPLPRPHRVWIAPTAALAVVMAAGSVWSVAAYTRLPLGEPVKAYVETGRLALKRAPRDAVVLDTHVPAEVAYPIFFYDYARVSKVLGPIAGRPVNWTRRLSGPVRGGPLIFDQEGRLRPAQIEGVTIPQSSRGCTEVAAKEVRFRLPQPIPQGDWTVQVGYLNPAAAELAVRLGGDAAVVDAEEGFGSTYAQVNGGGGELSLRTRGGGTVCVGEIKIGVPRPAGHLAPIPPEPVRP
ncbi:hypothetical protein ITP53_14340 [Nonomuraea sp. K274]|uniref:Uncharacterized protein n=1 Tax=Nonomuraea cypriaca TaxID=1187855 RepID=A0A931A5W0_9ACTN|nr:hypothetical protein [Nonomuraea cypriaca]MBF8186897.1 hypothetical protein [Nonomuraea cypriaca]